MKKIIYCLAIGLCPVLVACQPIVIKGKVIDEEGKPVSGATITLKRTNQSAISDNSGSFTIHDSRLTDTIIISAVGYQTTEEPNNERGLITITLKRKIATLAEVIVSTGYQDLPKERATGAFDFIDSASLNRRISANILDKLENTGAVYFDRRNGAQNISIRGRSTIFANASPLIVVDNFPYAGDLSDINPDDIENVTILKDAAAASVWGAFSGNGVIIINTKKGKTGQLPKLEFTANVTRGQKPDLFYDRNFLDAADYIGVEQMLYAKGFYNNDINNTTNRPILSPVVELLVKRANNQVTAADSASQINTLSKLDVRRQLLDYLYRNSYNTQYHLNYSGSSGKYNYFLSVGYDKGTAYLVRNSNERISLRSSNTFNLSSGWQVSIAMVYTVSNSSINNSGTALVTPSGKSVYPYEQVKDAQGNNLAIPKDYRTAWLDTAGNGKLLNWQYKPLDELAAANNRTTLSHALVDVGITYKLDKNFNAQLKYRYEKQTGEGSNLYSHDTYLARNLINLFTQVNGTQIKYQVPNEGILDRSFSAMNAYFIRGQLNYNRSWNHLHQVAALAGAELQQNHRTASSNRIYGYNDDLLTTGVVNYVDLLPTYNNVGSIRNIPNSVFLADNINRFVSVFVNGSYTYNTRYIFSLSARKDASNVFGVSTNQKWVPLWSSGFAWQIDKEGFFKSKIFSSLKARVTYGYNGNVDNTLSALATLLYFSFPSSVNNQTYANVNNPPNPELRWERTRQINVGFDFIALNERIAGSMDYYLKKGKDLIGYAAIDPTTGIIDQTGTSFTYKGNVADMKGNGVELDITTKNLVGKITWQSRIDFNYATNKIIKYNFKSPSAASYVGDGSFITPVVGKPVSSIFSYRWAGLDPLTGDPQGYDANKQISKDYTALLNVKTEDLEYSGSAVPVVYGFITNTVAWKNFSLSAAISYKLGYYFRKTSVNYGALYSQWRGNADFMNRWKNPGDEVKTNVPSMIYPNNSNRDVFYAGSSALIEKGDHIRLQDISLAYIFRKEQLKKFFTKELQLYVYANNLGIIWRANRSGLDPDYYGSGFPLPRTIAFGLKTNF